MRPREIRVRRLINICYISVFEQYSGFRVISIRHGFGRIKNILLKVQNGEKFLL